MRIQITGRERGRVSRLLFAIVLLCSHSAIASEDDPCRSPDPVGQPFRLTLLRSHLDQRGFVGIFELENSGTQAITIPGRKSKDAFAIDRPEVTVEFRDLTLSWQPLLALPGSFMQRPDRLTIRHGERAQVTAALMSKELADQSASQFRILIRLFDSSTCIASVPFTPLPRREPVTGFESAPEK